MAEFFRGVIWRRWEGATRPAREKGGVEEFGEDELELWALGYWADCGLDGCVNRGDVSVLEGRWRLGAVV